MMHRKELTRQKIKRILIYYRELERLHLSHEGAMMLMTYVFSLSERWIEDILRTNDLKDYEDIELAHLDLDMKLIDNYAAKCQREAIKQRKEQLKLF